MQPVIMRYGALNIDPLVFCAGTVGFAACGAVAMLAWSGELRLLLDRTYLPRLLGVSMAGTVATTLTLIYGLAKIDAVAGVILLESEPVYSLLMATAFLGERPSLRQLAATATILAGIGSVVGAGRAFSPFYAAALVFITPLFWQTSHVLSLRVMPPLTPRCLTGARYIYAAVVLVVIALVGEPRALSQLAEWHVLAVVCFAGVFVFLLGSLTWYGAISRLSLAWTTAFVIPGVPILSFLFAMIFLGEHPSRREIFGIAIAICGVAMLVIGADASRPSRVAGEAAEAVHQPIG
jgi:drug/metabolite transporter (DMT)-like permease